MSLFVQANTFLFVRACVRTCVCVRENEKESEKATVREIGDGTTEELE